MDDDLELRVALRSLLRSSGLGVQDYGSAEDYLGSGNGEPDCLIVDVSMPGQSGPELLRQLRDEGRSVPAIFISARELPSATALGFASVPFFQKPFGDELLLSAVRSAICRANPSAQSDRVSDISAKECSMKSTSLRAVEDAPTDTTSQETTARGFARIVGSDAGLALTVQRAQLLTKVEAPLLLQGATGVGKELFARAVHEELHAPAQGASTDAQAPFVVLNCAGLPPELLARELFGYVEGAFAGAPSGGMIGKLQQADGGTLFLDEIADLPAELQPYLLRVLESGEFYPLGSSVPRQTRFRLIAASSRDLRAEAHAERFRMDLYFRISVTMLDIPPLHERPEDVPLLVAHYTAEAVARHGLSEKTFAPEVLSAFAHYAWPGNVRELRSTVESLCLLSDKGLIDLSMLPVDLRPGASLSILPAFAEARDQVELPRGLQRVERAAIADALRCYQGNLTRVAQELQIARSTLYLKLKKYELEPVLTELRFGPR